MIVLYSSLMDKAGFLKILVFFKLEIKNILGALSPCLKIACTNFNSAFTDETNRINIRAIIESPVTVILKESIITIQKAFNT